MTFNQYVFGKTLKNQEKSEVDFDLMFKSRIIRASTQI